MPIVEYRGKKPQIGNNVFIMHSATLIGDVVLGDNVLVMANVVLRADYGQIRIGDRVVLLENAVVNPPPGEPVVIEGDCLVGYGARIHGGRIGRRVFVGMNSVLMHGVELGEHSYLGACAVLPGNARIPAGSVAMGMPARVVREAGPDDRVRIEFAVDQYMKTLDRFQAELGRWEIRWDGGAP